MEERKYFTVDLHSHTPASTDYNAIYEIEDENYIDYLEKYHESDIDVIAITDHNTIDGYKKLMDLKEKCSKTIEYLSDEKYELKEEIQLVIEENKKILDLFEGKLFIPGIEITTFEGIHILAIFTPNKPLEEIENLIADCGHDLTVNNTTSPTTFSVMQIMEMCKENGGYVIAAHANSSKGILTELEGISRQTAILSDYLDGMQVTKLSSVNFSEELIASSGRTRTNKLSYILATDFHNKVEDELNKSVSYMLMKTNTFNELIYALHNPIECISFSKNPDEREILNKYVQSSSSIHLKELDNSIIKSVNALANQNGGDLVIGVEDKSLIGSTSSKTEVEEKLFDAIERNESKNLISHKLTSYDFGTNKIFVISIKPLKNDTYFLDGNLYVVSDNRAKKANAEVASLLHERIKSRNEKKFDSIISKIITKASKEILVAANYTELKSLYKKITQKTVRLFDILDIEPINSNKDIEIEEAEGSHTGNLYFASQYETPHFEYAYSRMSCKRVQYDKYNAGNEYVGNSIILVFGGRAYYIEDDEGHYFLTTVPAIRLTVKEQFKDIVCLKSVLAWLKSPVCLWQSSFAFNSINLYLGNVFTELRIPLIGCFENGGTISKITDAVIEQELKFLEASGAIYDETFKEEAVLPEDFKEIITNHNTVVYEKALEIEDFFDEELNLTEKERDLIYEFCYDSGMKFFLDASALSDD